MLAAGGVPRLIPSTADKRFQLSAQDVAQHWTPATQGVLVASPSNPTGTSIAHGELAELLAQVRARDGFAIVDEIYLGLSYEGQPRSADAGRRRHRHQQLLQVLPHDRLAPGLDDRARQHGGGGREDRLQPGHLRAHAGPARRAGLLHRRRAQDLRHRRGAFKQRRDYLLPEFERLGLRVPVKPDGAFYIYADISDLGMDSAAFSQRLLLEAGVAAVPGLDFGPAHGDHTMRFSYATGLDRLEAAVDRMGKLLGH